MNKFGLFALALAAGSLPPIEPSRVQSLRQIFEQSSPSSAPIFDGDEAKLFHKWTNPANNGIQINDPHVQESNPDGKPEIQSSQRARIPQQSEKYRKFQQWRGYR